MTYPAPFRSCERDVVHLVAGADDLGVQELLRVRNGDDDDGEVASIQTSDDALRAREMNPARRYSTSANASTRGAAAAQRTRSSCPCAWFIVKNLDKKAIRILRSPFCSAASLRGLLSGRAVDRWGAI